MLSEMDLYDMRQIALGNWPQEVMEANSYWGTATARAEIDTWQSLKEYQ